MLFVCWLLAFDAHARVAARAAGRKFELRVKGHAPLPGVARRRDKGRRQPEAEEAGTARRRHACQKTTRVAVAATAAVVVILLLLSLLIIIIILILISSSNWAASDCRPQAHSQ